MVDYGLKDKVAIITGANNPQGIGAATAIAFAREGAKVVLTYKKVPREYDDARADENGADRYYRANAGDASEVEEKLIELGVDYLVLEKDISDEAQVKEIFDAAFDGTYESLRKMCDTDTENRPVIATSAFGKRALLFFLGYSGDFRTSYNPQTQEFVNIIRQKQTKELLQTVYEDCKTGRLVKAETAAGIPENTIVYISQGPDDVPEGFTLFSVSDAQPLYTLGLSYGVAADSQRKELAMQVLGACYSNPRIASLLCWGVSDEKDWMEYTATAKAAAEPIVSLAGFVPDLTEKQYRALRRYDDDIVSLCSRMFLNSTGKPILNRYYEEVLDSFFEKQNDYDDLFEVINRQWKQWAAKAK